MFDNHFSASQSLRKTFPPNALDTCFLYSETLLLGELHAVSAQLALDNLCVKVWLFIQCALYSIATLKKKTKRGMETAL